MAFYQEQVLPRLVNVALGGKAFHRIRSRVASGLSGKVLEVGFGSGLNVGHYPPDVERVLAVDPAIAGRRLAARRVDESLIPVEYVGLDGQILPVDSSSIDNVLVTWSMCTIPDVGAALREMHRVLRPGGELHFVEHGLSPEPDVARWQHRLTPLQSAIFGGCHLNRPIDRLVIDAGFTMDRIDTYYMKGLKSMGYMFEGVATKAPPSAHRRATPSETINGR